MRNAAPSAVIIFPHSSTFRDGDVQRDRIKVRDLHALSKSQ